MGEPLNYIMISPHFPSNFEPFTVRLAENGFRVLGIADAPYDELTEPLKHAMTEYYRVDDMEDYEQVYRAVAYFAFKYGKIDFLESHNEHWLVQDAQLREDFNIPGMKPADMDQIKYKSKMKEVFRKAKLPVAKGRVFTDMKDAKKLVKQLGYPVIVKPDSGVGASDTWKIKTPKELEAFFEQKKEDVSYIMEEYISGNVVTYDGLVDRDGNVVFDSSITHDRPVLDTLDGNDMYFFIEREVPADIREMGLKAVKAFGFKERFFHFELFRLKDNTLMMLELNCRPPGGYTIDLWNYANSFDIFDLYARMLQTNEFQAPLNRPYYAAYVSRHNHLNYAHSKEDIYATYPDYVISDVWQPSIFAHVMGDIGFIVRSEKEDKLLEVMNFIRAKRN